MWESKGFTQIYNFKTDERGKGRERTCGHTGKFLIRGHVALCAVLIDSSAWGDGSCF